MVTLLDTSAWIEFEKATESPADVRLAELFAIGADVATNEPVIMEVLAGARSATRFATLRRAMNSLHLLPVLASADYIEAAVIYRRCRAVGITPRGLTDCLVAAVAARTGATLLAHDADLTRIAEVIGLELDAASLRP